MPKVALPFLSAKLKPLAAADKQMIRRWIADLDSDDFDTRSVAHKELARLGDQVLPAVEETLKGKPSLETRRRLEPILEAMHAIPSREVIRVLRAVQALELIGNADARTLLQAIAKGAAGARQTREAQESLARLNKRARDVPR